MAELARAVGIDPMITIVESESLNTWSNVQLSSALVEDSEMVILISDPVHAAWARRYSVMPAAEILRRCGERR